MNFIFEKMLKLIGIEKLFLMAWNVFYPTLKKKCEESDAEWDDDLLRFLNELVVLVTGAGKKSELADVKKPEGIKKIA